MGFGNSEEAMQMQAGGSEYLQDELPGQVQLPLRLVGLPQGTRLFSLVTCSQDNVVTIQGLGALGYACQTR